MKNIIKLTTFILLFTCTVASAQTTATKDTVASQEWDAFGKLFSNKLQFPAIAMEQRAQGELTAIFAVDSTHTIQYIKVEKSPMDAFSQQIFKIMLKRPVIYAATPGEQYRLSVLFTIEKQDGSPVGKGTAQPGEVLTYNPTSVVIPTDRPVHQLKQIICTAAIL